MPPSASAPTAARSPTSTCLAGSPITSPLSTRPSSFSPPTSMRGTSGRNEPSASPNPPKRAPRSFSSRRRRSSSKATTPRKTSPALCDAPKTPFHQPTGSSPRRGSHPLRAACEAPGASRGDTGQNRTSRCLRSAQLRSTVRRAAITAAERREVFEQPASGPPRLQKPAFGVGAHSRLVQPGSLDNGLGSDRNFAAMHQSTPTRPAVSFIAGSPDGAQLSATSADCSVSSRRDRRRLPGGSTDQG